MSIALLLIALAIVSGTIWQRRHPATSLVARLAELPALLVPAPAIVTPAPPITSAARAPEAPKADAPQQALKTDAPPQAAKTGAPRQAASLAPSGAPAPVAAQAQAAAALPAPRFDIVRVEPKGDTLVAGSGAPHAKVALLASGKVVAETRADDAGQFVIMPQPLPPGDYDLTLRQTPDGPPDASPAGAISTQSVAVSVPHGADKSQAVVALAEPGRPTRLLSAPPAPAAQPASLKPEAPKQVPQSLGIRSVELENGSGFYATGAAKPGTPVHVYLNETHLADVVAGADGNWSVIIRKGLAGGRYRVRADAGQGSTVAARAEVAFEVPTAMGDAATAVSPGDSRAPRLASLRAPRSDTEMPQAKASADRASRTPVTGDTLDIASAAAPPSAQQPAHMPASAIGATPDATPDLPLNPSSNPQSTPPADAARAVIEEIRTRQVLGGDNLWNISRERLGFGRRFTQIYAANSTQIRDPKLIYPGQVFVLPPK